LRTAADHQLTLATAPRRIAALFVLPVLLIGCAVFGAASIERNTALHAGAQSAAAQTPLRDVEREQLGPRSCMAMRLSRSYERRPSDEPLLRCDVCGRIESDVLCEPLLGRRPGDRIGAARPRATDR
jgi:hypothetical protein